jgi:CheY-like chemotaxis protein
MKLGARGELQMQNILVVDDEDQVRNLINTILKGAGYLVRVARNGNEASQLLNQWEPDLIITDIAMPEKAGNELIQEVRTLHPAIRIIAISGAATAQPGIYLRMANSLGADQILAKPFLPDDLLRIVKLTLNK